jgi:hypothetical protein
MTSKVFMACLKAAASAGDSAEQAMAALRRAAKS